VQVSGIGCKHSIILFGSTTENPSFEVISPLLSRMRVLLLNPLSEDTLVRIIKEALIDKIRGLGNRRIKIDSLALKMLIDYANGDARRALNSLEIAAEVAKNNRITKDVVKEAFRA